MQISSSYSNTQIPSGIDPKVVSEQASSRVQSSVKQQKADNEQAQNSNNTKTKQRFEVSEQAIALFEEQQANSQNILLADTQNPSSSKQQNTSQDQASQQNQTAISAYQKVGNIAQRESVQALFGVDILA